MVIPYVKILLLASLLLVCRYCFSEEIKSGIRNVTIDGTSIERINIESAIYYSKNSALPGITQIRCGKKLKGYSFIAVLSGSSLAIMYYFNNATLQDYELGRAYDDYTFNKISWSEYRLIRRDLLDKIQENGRMAAIFGGVAITTLIIERIDASKTVKRYIDDFFRQNSLALNIDANKSQSFLFLQKHF